MKVLVLYRQNSENARAVETFIRDFRYQHEDDADKLEAVDIDSRDGVAMANLYDIVEYPAILAVSDDGQVIKSWVGSNLPLMDELAGYIYSY